VVRWPDGPLATPDPKLLALSSEQLSTKYMDGRTATRSGRGLLLSLLVLVFSASFMLGIQTKQRDVLFYPSYRTTYSIAVALSMMRQPRAPSYQAYEAIVNELKAHGFTQEQWGVTGRDPAIVNQAINAALRIPIQPGGQTQRIQANDLGYAHFIFLAFKLFGATLSSIYYFYFLLLLISVLAFVAQFHSSRFMLFVLSLYLTAHIFVVAYCTEFGLSIGSIANSRTFSALGLLPALHLASMLLARVPFGALSIATALLQSLLLSFVISCRYDVMWEAGLVVSTALVWAPYLVLSTRGKPLYRLSNLRRLWPAAVLMAALLAMQVLQSGAAGPSYDKDSGKHLVWHEILLGMLSVDGQLIQKYAGMDAATTSQYVWDDRVACEAVRHYLSHLDVSSRSAPRYDCDAATNIFGGDSGEYDAIAQRVVAQIIMEQPLAVLRGVKSKLYDQLQRFSSNLHLRNLILPLLAFFACFLIYGVAIRFVPDWHGTSRAILLGVISVTCALITPAIEPSVLAVGTLATFLMAGFLLISYAVLALREFHIGYFARRLFGLNGRSG
jgi:hypothetical protein